MKGADIFNDDEAYRNYQEIKEQQEKLKKERIDKVLDEYCYQQLNLPASEYRSQHTHLLYTPQYYPMQIVNPQREQYTSQFIGFNQNSNATRKRQKVLQLPQQLNYQSPFLNSAQQQLTQQYQYQQQQQTNFFPSLSTGQGNIGYTQQMPNNNDYQYVEVVDTNRKEDFIKRCDRLYGKMNTALKYYNSSSIF